MFRSLKRPEWVQDPLESPGSCELLCRCWNKTWVLCENCTFNLWFISPVPCILNFQNLGWQKCSCSLKELFFKARYKHQNKQNQEILLLNTLIILNLTHWLAGLVLEIWWPFHLFFCSCLVLIYLNCIWQKQIKPN